MRFCEVGKGNLAHCHIALRSEFHFVELLITISQDVKCDLSVTI